LEALQLLATEFSITISNPDVWLSIGLALVLGGACWAFGTWVARVVGLLPTTAPAGETLGVGLAAGLMVFSACWAAIWSGGRSSFTPVAVGFLLALCLAIVRRVRRRSAQPRCGAEDAPPTEVAPRRGYLVTAVLSGLFVTAIALLYGSTMAPSPRDGLQPVEFNDTAFYAVLGRDLATTGTETNLSASGFSDLQGLPVQTWYHWAEIWLASAVITVFGTAPMAARYFVVLPVVLLAAAAMTGTLVRRVAKTNSRRAYGFGVFACLFLAPVPLIPGPYFSSWATGLIFGITLYGLSAVAAALALYSLIVLNRREASWTVAAFVGSAAAFVVPAHLAVAILGLLGLGSIGAIRILQSIRTTRRLPILSPVWRRTFLVAALVVAATVVWGFLVTAHGFGGTVPTIVSPFNASWRDSVAITVLGAGAFFAIAFAWFLARKARAFEAELYVGTSVLLIGGAIGWGARLGDFTMFYLFYAGIAVIATPAAAIAVRTLWESLGRARHRRLAFGLLVLCVLQLELGAWNGVLRMQLFGPHAYEPIPVSVLDAIRRLPLDAKLAYKCQPLDESGFAVPQLLAIDAHTARRVVPMCFEAEVLSTLIGADTSDQVPNLFFRWAPQRALYPDAAARPSSEASATFLKAHGIGFVYADAMHPNTLVNNAVLVATDRSAVLLRIP
jgi:hypothetical protein